MWRRDAGRLSLFTLALGAVVLTVPALATPLVQSSPQPSAPASQRAMLDRYCVTCHSERNKATAGGLALDKIDLADVAGNGEVLERVVRKLRFG